MRVRPLVVATFAAAFLAGAPAHANLIINPTFDVSITSDPNAAAIQGAINAAIALVQATFADPIQVNITFQEMNTGLGESLTSIFDTAYSSYRTALNADKTSADDVTALAIDAPATATSPVDGLSNIWVTRANMRAIGLLPAFGGGSDGTISLNTSLMSFTHLPTPGLYDAEAVALHEIDEVLGMGSGLNLPVDFPRQSRPQDLFRYSATGVRSYTTSGSAVSYFSIDGGVTNLVHFNQNGGGDYGDWLTEGTPKVQDAFGTSGSVPVYGVEARNLDVIGYDLAAPEPGTMMLLAAGLGLVGFKARRSVRVR